MFGFNSGPKTAEEYYTNKNIGKAATVATVIGAVAYGVKNPGKLGQFVQEAVEIGLKQSLGKEGGLWNLAKDSVKGFTGKNLSARVFSEPVTELIDSLRQVNTVATSESVAAARQQVVTGHLSQLGFGDDAVNEITSVLRDSFTATSVEAGIGHLNKSKTLDAVTQIAGRNNVPFNQMDVSDILSRSLTQAFEVSGRASSSSGKKLIQSSKENVETVYNAITESLDKVDGKQKHVREALHASGFREVKMGELMDEDGKLTAMGRHVSEQTTLQAGTARGENFIESAFSQFNTALKKTFSTKRNEMVSDGVAAAREAEARLKIRFQETGSGVYVNEDNKVLLASAIERHAKVKASKAFSEVSIPLLPGLFDVRVSKLFGFAKGTARNFHNLGRFGAQGELTRLNTGISNNATLMKAGDGLLAFDSESRTIKRVNGTYKVIAKRGSLTTAEFAKTRSTPVEGFGLNPDASTDWRETIVNYVKGESIDTTYLRKAVVNAQDSLFSVSAKDDDIIFTPSKAAEKLGLNKALFTQMMDEGILNLSELSPKNLESIVNSEASSRLKNHAASQFLNKVGAVNEDLSEDIAILLQRRGSDTILKDLLDASKDPEQLMGVIRSLNDDSSEYLLNRPALFRAVEQVQSDPLSVLDTQPGYGFLHQIRDGLLGETKASKTTKDLQEAIFTTGLITHSELQQFNTSSLLEAKNILQSSDPRSWGDNVFLNLIKKVGNFNPENLDETVISNIDSFLGHLQTSGRTGADGTVKAAVDEDALRTLLTSVLPQRRLNNLSSVGKAKAYSSIAEANNTTNHIFGRFGLDVSTATNARVVDLANDSQVADVIRNRFRHANLSKDFTDTTITAGSDYYVVPRANGSLKDVLNTTFNGLTDPSAPQNVPSYLMTAFMQMPNEMGAKLGLGLSTQDRMTALRTGISTYTKRVLPLIVGGELLRNINGEADDRGIPGIDDVVGNSLAKISIAKKIVMEELGVTDVMKNLVNTYPALRGYFDPKTTEEYREYLAYGSTGVRRSRFWAIGSRSPFHGEEIDFYRPNYFRRLTSGWQSAENVELANPEHSFLPTLSNPLAPISRLLNPGWWLDSQKDYRAYQDNGRGMRSMSGAASMNLTSYGIGSQAALESSGNGEIAMGTLVPKLGVAFGHGGGGDGPGGAGPGGGGPGGGGYGGMYGGGMNFYASGLEYQANRSIAQPGGIAATVSSVSNVLQRYREQGGLYGAFIKLMPFGMEPIKHKQSFQNPKDATDFKRHLFSNQMGEIAGPLGEYYRRLLGFYKPDLYADTPFYNNMPSWMPAKFQTGDPYLKVKGIGELLLPGDAFERANPWVKPMRASGSTIGKTEDEIVRYFLRLEPGAESDALDFGSHAHQLVQTSLAKAGSLIAAEVPIYNEEENISGTIDAIVESGAGPKVLEIKTQNSKDFNEGLVPEEYLDQVNFYMEQTGLEGMLGFVNSNDPSQVRMVEVNRDPVRLQAAYERINRARERIIDLVDRGAISPFETYSPIARLQVLSKTAPSSAETTKLYRDIADGKHSLTPQERIVFEHVEKEYLELRRQYNTNTTVNNIKLKSVRAKVIGFGKKGEIITDKGTFRPAGVEFNRNAFHTKTPEELYDIFNLQVGDSKVFHINRSIDNDSRRGEVMAAAMGNLTEKLVNSEFASKAEGSQDPVDRLAAWGRANTAVEYLLHTDNLLTNKWLRSRTATEQLERGEIFGTDYASWTQPFATIAGPTITSFMKKDPISAGIQTALTASFFVKSSAAKARVAAWAGMVGAVSTVIPSAYSALTGKAWKPSRTKKLQENDEYYEALDFLKQSGTFEAAKVSAYINEGVNVEAIAAGTETPERVGPISLLAVEAKRRLSTNRFALDMSKATLAEAIASLPNRHQQLAYEVAMYADQKEKNRFYSLLPDSEKRVLAKFLGQPLSARGTPNVKNVAETLRGQIVPGSKWGGWGPNVDLDVVKRFANEQLGAIQDNPRGNDLIDITVPGRRTQIFLPQGGNGGKTFRNLSRTLVDVSRDIIEDMPLSLKLTPSATTEVEIKSTNYVDLTDQHEAAFDTEVRTMVN